jgi:SPP1 gp7 family putative phage head morphogenesis protein
LGINFDMPTDRMQKLAAEQTQRITGISDTIEIELRRELSAGINDGESVTQLAGRLRGVFNMASSRALTIARTELVGAANQASLMSMQEAKVAKVQWVTAGDELVRESHQEQDGEEVESGEAFTNGLTYPGEQTGDPGESINCRCTLVPVV